jgi:hypothetical protein
LNQLESGPKTAAIFLTGCGVRRIDYAFGANPLNEITTVANDYDDLCPARPFNTLT